MQRQTSPRLLIPSAWSSYTLAESFSEAIGGNGLGPHVASHALLLNKRKGKGE
jgi:hypothetical protein